MTSDEQAIHKLLTTWQQASKTEDLPTVLRLMAEDAVFLTPGRPPIRGREEFARLSAGSMPFDIESDSSIEELVVEGNWAYCWSRLSIRLSPKEGGAVIRRSGMF